MAHSIATIVVVLVAAVVLCANAVEYSQEDNQVTSTTSVVALAVFDDDDAADDDLNATTRTRTNETNMTRSEDDGESALVANLLYSLIFVPIIVTTLVGNMLVILAVVIVRKLHSRDNANNYLIVSLAVSDFLVGVLAMPFAFYVQLSHEHRWYLGAILCDLWTMSDVLLCTASILNLCAISVDRYFIILHAMVYTQKRNAKLMLLMILIVWATSALISIPPLFGWGKPSARLGIDQMCQVSSDLKYQIYASLLAFYLPLIAMIIIYINIFKAAAKIKKREQSSTCQVQKPALVAAATASSHLEPLLEDGTGTAVSGSNLAVNESMSVGGGLFPSSSRHTISHHAHGGGPRASTLRPAHLSFSDRDSTGSSSRLNANNVQQFGKYLGRRLTSVITGIKRNSTAQSNSGKNQKATRTLGIIMGCFTLCWLPFFIFAIVKPIEIGDGVFIGDYVPGWLDTLLLWLGYLNSTLNPVIYACFNKEFRRPFYEILCLRFKGINEKLRDEERKKMYSKKAMNSHMVPLTTNNNNNNQAQTPQHHQQQTQFSSNHSSLSAQKSLNVPYQAHELEPLNHSGGGGGDESVTQVTKTLASYTPTWSDVIVKECNEEQEDEAAARSLDNVDETAVSETSTLRMLKEANNAPSSANASCGDIRAARLKLNLDEIISECGGDEKPIIPIDEYKRQVELKRSMFFLGVGRQAMSNNDTPKPLAIDDDEPQPPSSPSSSDNDGDGKHEQPTNEASAELTTTTEVVNVVAAAAASVTETEAEVEAEAKAEAEVKDEVVNESVQMSNAGDELLDFSITMSLTDDSDSRYLREDVRAVERLTFGGGSSPDDSMDAAYATTFDNTSSIETFKSADSKKSDHLQQQQQQQQQPQQFEEQQEQQEQQRTKTNDEPNTLLLTSSESTTTLLHSSLLPEASSTTQPALLDTIPASDPNETESPPPSPPLPLIDNNNNNNNHSTPTAEDDTTNGTTSKNVNHQHNEDNVACAEEAEQQQQQQQQSQKHQQTNDNDD